MNSRSCTSLEYLGPCKWKVVYLSNPTWVIGKRRIDEMTIDDHSESGLGWETWAKQAVFWQASSVFDTRFEEEACQA